MKNLKNFATFMCSQRLSIALMTLLIMGSVCLDQVTKVVAEKNLMVWQDLDDLRNYQGQRHHLLTLGDTSESTTEQSFWLSFNFNYVRNQGAAWGFLSNVEDHIRIPFFYLVTFIAIFVIIMYLKTTPATHRLARFALTLILSGAIGNFVDRLRLGYVIDFLDVRWAIPLPFQKQIQVDFFPSFLNFLNGLWDLSIWRYHFPNFNWADSTITIGVSLLFIDMLFFETKRNQMNLL